MFTVPVKLLRPMLLALKSIHPPEMPDVSQFTLIVPDPVIDWVMCDRAPLPFVGLSSTNVAIGLTVMGDTKRSALPETVEGLRVSVPLLTSVAPV